ncbi:MAG: tetratricopeptide repeat protein [Bacteroidetes bacterium]|nr:tetratricopeptide repeat protein [Bacteroidota bacterium]
MFRYLSYGRVLSVAALMLILFSGLTKAQYKYNFDFGKDWDWVDLLIDEQSSLFGVQEQIKYLRDEFQIEEGRILFRELAKLDSLNQLRGLPEVINEDIVKNRRYFFSIYMPAVKDIDFGEHFGGIVRAAVFVAKIRDNFNEEKKPFQDRRYIVKLTELKKSNIQLNFNYNAADNILDALTKNVSESDIVSTPEMKFLLENFDNQCVTREDLENCFRQVRKDDPLTKIYILSNPMAFMCLGYVEQFLSEYKKSLDLIKREQQNILENSVYLLSLFFPENIDFKNNVYMFYGSRNCGWRYRDNSILLDLSRFGDNYELLTKYLTRELFFDERDDIQLNILKYLYTREDTLIYNLLDEVYSNGVSNYIAPILQANRPSSLLEKDFILFKKTMKAIEDRRPQNVIDSMFSLGVTDMYFHSMGAQMAYCIDVYMGRDALRQTLLFGPLYFFEKYIETYMLDDSPIRSVFRLPSNIETKIYNMGAGISYDMLSDVVNVKVLYNDSAQMNPQVGKIYSKYKGRKDIWFLNFITGKLYLDKAYYPQSLDYFMNCMQGINDRMKFVRDIGDIYFENKAYKESAKMYDKYVTYSGGILDSYLKRGAAYFESGEIDKAKQDFETVIKMDPDNTKAKEYLIK